MRLSYLSPESSTAPSNRAVKQQSNSPIDNIHKTLKLFLVVTKNSLLSIYTLLALNAYQPQLITVLKLRIEFEFYLHHLQAAIDEDETGHRHCSCLCSGPHERGVIACVRESRMRNLKT